MVPRKEGLGDETQLNEELDVFEEFEMGEPAEEQTAGGSHAAAPDAGEADLPEGDFAGFEESDEPAPAPRMEGLPPEREARFDAPSETAAKGLADELQELAPDVPVNLAAVVGRATTSVGDLIRYRVGQVLDLGRQPGETVDLVANGRLIARGELVEVDGRMGVRILKMVR